MLTSTSSPFFLSILFQIITLKTQLPCASLLTTTLSITNTQKKKKAQKTLRAKPINATCLGNIFSSNGAPAMVTLTLSSRITWCASDVAWREEEVVVLEGHMRAWAWRVCCVVLFFSKIKIHDT